MYHTFSLHVAMGVSLHLILFHNPHAAWKNSKRICVHIRNSYCVWFFIAQKIPHQMKHQMCIILLIIWCVCTVHCYGADETKDPFKFDQRPLFLYSSEVQQYYFALCWNSSDALFHHWIKSSLKMPIITDISNAASIQHFACPIHELLLTFYWTKNTEKNTVLCRLLSGNVFETHTSKCGQFRQNTLFWWLLCVRLCVCDFHSERISIINLCVWIRMEVNWWLYCHSYAWWKCNLIRWQSFGLNETQHSNAHSSVRGIPFELSTLLACIQSACHCNVFNV